MQFVRKTTTWILRFLKLQLFISLFAMPILLWWGLPMSILSPLGNLLFGPALTLFLLLSSLLFFTELLYIPNAWIAWCLDMLTKIWLYILKSDSHPWLFGFATPSSLFLVSIPLLALLILHFKTLRSLAHSVLCLSILLVGSCLYIKNTYTKTNTLQTIPYGRGELTILHDQKKLVVIDPGIIGQRISSASWIEYTLCPELIKTSGKTTIDHLILLQPGAMLFEAITTLAAKVKIKEIYLICWQGSMTKHEWFRFFTMKRTLEAQGTKMHRITHKTIELNISKTCDITIQPLPQTIKQKEIQYPAIEVSGHINRDPFQVHTHKYKPHLKPSTLIT